MNKLIVEYHRTQMWKDTAIALAILFAFSCYVIVTHNTHGEKQAAKCVAERAQ